MMNMAEYKGKFEIMSKTFLVLMWVTTLEDIYEYIVWYIYRYKVGDIYRYIVGDIYRNILWYFYRYMVGYLQIYNNIIIHS